MIIPAIVKRRSVRSYKPDPIQEKDLLEIIEAAQYAPTAKNNKSIEFIVIKDKNLKNKLKEILFQDFIRQAQIVIVPVIDTTKSIAPVQDLSIASQTIFLQAISLGLGTVWKNVSDEQRTQIKKLLKIPKHFLLVNVIPLGIPVEIPPQHTEKEFDPKKIHHNMW